MAKEPNELDRLIQHYLEGKCTAEEKIRLHYWMESLRISEEKITEEDVLLLKERIDAIIQPAEVKVKKMRWPRLSAAVVLIIGLAGASFLYLRIQNRQVNSEQIVANEVIFPKDVHRLCVYHNHSASNRKIQLSEGTQVTLTPNSGISFLEDFEKDSRHVWLCGKARFDVAKDAIRPFSVVTGDIHTTAIGTVFWVTHLQTQSVPTVQLLSGKVTITQKNDHGAPKLLAALQPGDIWDSHGRHLPIIKTEDRPVSKKMESGEKRETALLTFHHTPLKDVFDLLADHFQISFSYQISELDGMTFYGNYSDQIMLEDILKHIMLTHEINIEYNPNTTNYEVTIY